MNISAVLGYILAAATVWFTVIAESPNPAMLLEIKGLTLVVGGTLAAGLAIYPFSQLKELLRFIAFGVVLKRVPNKRRLVRELVAAANFKPEEHTLLPICPAHHPFLAEGFRLLAENRLNETNLRDVLTRRSSYFKQAYMNDAKILATLAKFPSSFGMLGSTVGLIDMMSELGQHGQEGIGPAMAMALVATFWGLVLTYMVFMPLSDYAARLANEDSSMRQLIIEGLCMVKRHEDPRVVLEKLNGFLSLQDRMAFVRDHSAEKFLKEIRKDIEQFRKQA